jgi:hypothetical protein
LLASYILDMGPDSGSEVDADDVFQDAVNWFAEFSDSDVENMDVVGQHQAETRKV